MNANTLEALATIKRFEPTSTIVSNEALLQVGDPTSKTKFQANGTPMFWLPPVNPGVPKS